MKTWYHDSGNLVIKNLRPLSKSKRSTNFKGSIPTAAAGIGSSSYIWPPKRRLVIGTLRWCWCPDTHWWPSHRSWGTNFNRRCCWCWFSPVVIVFTLVKQFCKKFIILKFLVLHCSRSLKQFKNFGTVLQQCSNCSTGNYRTGCCCFVSFIRPVAFVSYFSYVKEILNSQFTLSTWYICL